MSAPGRWHLSHLNHRVSVIKGKTKLCIWDGNPSQNYGASRAIWDHTVLCATRIGSMDPCGKIMSVDPFQIKHFCLFFVIQ